MRGRSIFAGLGVNGLLKLSRWYVAACLWISDVQCVRCGLVSRGHGDGYMLSVFARALWAYVGPEGVHQLLRGAVCDVVRDDSLQRVRELRRGAVLRIARIGGVHELLPWFHSAGNRHILLHPLRRRSVHQRDRGRELCHLLSWDVPSILGCWQLQPMHRRNVRGDYGEHIFG
jgi:hypothetical protein